MRAAASARRACETGHVESRLTTLSTGHSRLLPSLCCEAMPRQQDVGGATVAECTHAHICATPSSHPSLSASASRKRTLLSTCGRLCVGGERGRMSADNGVGPPRRSNSRFPKPPADVEAGKAHKPSPQMDKRSSALHISFAGDDSSLHAKLAEIAAHAAELQTARGALWTARSRDARNAHASARVRAPQAESLIRHALHERSQVAESLRAQERLTAALATERGRVQDAEASAARLETERQVRGRAAASVRGAARRPANPSCGSAPRRGALSVRTKRARCGAHRHPRPSWRR